MTNDVVQRTSIWILILFLGLQLLLFAPRLNSDGAYYYEFVRSLVLQNDLNFDDEREFFTWEWVPVFRDYLPGAWGDTGYLPNIFSFGPAMIWMPFYLIAHGMTQALHVFGIPVSQTGYGISYRLFPMLVSMLAGLFTLCLIDRKTKTLGYSRNARNLALAAILGASNLPAFLFVTPAFSHAISTMASSAFFFLWLESRDSSWTAKRYALFGLVAGVMMTARWQNGVNLILPLLDAILDLVPREGRKTVLTRLVDWFWFSVSFLIILTPQLMVTGILYGNPFVDPQGQGGMHWLTPRFDLVLFEATKGLFVVNPIFFPAVLGVFVLTFKRFNRVAFGSIMLLMLHLYINAIRRDWAGVGFGMRRFLDLVPVFSIGLMAFFDLFHVERRRWIARVFVFVIGCLSIWNLLLMGQYYFSRLGAPWVLMTRAEMVMAQFTQAPSLLKMLIGTSLMGQWFTQGVKIPLIAALVSLMITVFCWHHWSLYRPSASERTVRWFVFSGIIFAILLDTFVGISAERAQPVHVVNLIPGDRFGTIRTLQLNPESGYSGWPGGIRFSGNNQWTQVDARVDYNKDAFLASGHMTLIPKATHWSGRWELTLPVPISCRSAALIWRPESSHVDAQPHHHGRLTIGFSDGTQKEIDIKHQEVQEIQTSFSLRSEMLPWEFPALNPIHSDPTHAYRTICEFGISKPIQWIRIDSDINAGSWMMHGLSIIP